LHGLYLPAWLRLVQYSGFGTGRVPSRNRSNARYLPGWLGAKHGGVSSAAAPTSPPGVIRVTELRTSTTKSAAPDAIAKVRANFAAEYQELEQLIAQTPEDATVKGMFLSSFLDSLDRGGHKRPTEARFLSFKDYSLREFMRLMLDAIATAWPTMPPSAGLRRLGQNAYPTLAESVVGRVLFSVAGRSFGTALQLTEKAYKVSLNPGVARLAQLTEKSAVLEMRDIWNFADCYQVGVMEGAMTAYRVKGEVRAQRLSRPCDVDLHLRWE